MPGRVRPRGATWASWEHLGLKIGATSRCHAEPRMNEAGLAAFSGARYFGATIASSVVTRRRRARMGNFRSPCPKETKDDRSSKIIVRGCDIGFCRARGDIISAGPDHA